MVGLCKGSLHRIRLKVPPAVEESSLYRKPLNTIKTATGGPNDDVDAIFSQCMVDAIFSQRMVDASTPCEVMALGDSLFGMLGGPRRFLTSVDEVALVVVVWTPRVSNSCTQRVKLCYSVKVPKEGSC